jgi:hypothetical protein
MEQTARRPVVSPPERSSDWWDPRTWCPDLAPGGPGSTGRIASSS